MVNKKLVTLNKSKNIMKIKKATSFNYETYVVHIEITSKVNFVEHQSANSIEDVVLKAINFNSIDNTIVKSFVKSFLSSVDYESISKYVNESLEGKEPSNRTVVNSGREWDFMDDNK